MKVKGWYNLGLELDIEDNVLQTIERNHPQDQDGCKRDMFRAWLQKCPQASYRQLVQALVELGEVSEADHLCRKHGEPCKQLILSPICSYVLSLAIHVAVGVPYIFNSPFPQGLTFPSQDPYNSPHRHTHAYTHSSGRRVLINW